MVHFRQKKLFSYLDVVVVAEVADTSSLDLSETAEGSGRIRSGP